MMGKVLPDEKDVTDEELIARFNSRNPTYQLKTTPNGHKVVLHCEEFIPYEIRRKGTVTESRIIWSSLEEKHTIRIAMRRLLINAEAFDGFDILNVLVESRKRVEQYPKNH